MWLEGGPTDRRVMNRDKTGVGETYAGVRRVALNCVLF